MICLTPAAEYSGVATTFTIISYTCIWIPFRRLKLILHNVIAASFMLFSTSPSSHNNEYHPADDKFQLNQELHLTNCSIFFDNSSALRTRRFEDVAATTYEDGRCFRAIVDESCSVCLVDFLKESDEVSQLLICGHVFHLHCIRRWIYQNNFTCPLCRSLINLE